MLVVGKKEVEEGALAVRRRSGGQEVLPVAEVISRLQHEIDTKALPPSMQPQEAK